MKVLSVLLILLVLVVLIVGGGALLAWLEASDWGSKP